MNARRVRRAWLLGTSLALAFLISACASTNTYPIDFFSEMHYQKSFGAGEPDGFSPPEGAVPITGGEVDYSMEEAADLDNPYEGEGDLAARGAEIYSVNCAHCHGADGEADTFIAGTFEGYGAARPANLREMPSDFNDGELFHVVTHGLGDAMPAFRMLLTEEERWAVVAHLRELED